MSSRYHVGDVGAGAVVLQGERINVAFYPEPSYPRVDYRHDADSILRFHNRVFVGRDAMLDEVRRLLAGGRPRYLLVEAAGGYGKSALSAWIVTLAEAGELLPSATADVIFFFVRADIRRDTAEAALAALNSQLLELLRLPGGVPPELEAQRQQFSALWSTATQRASEERPLLLLLDGLDELRTQVSLPDLLPGFLGAAAYVLVSCRPSFDAPSRVGLDHPLRDAQIQRLHVFDDAEITQLLERYGFVNRDAQAFAARILSVTGGEPLFARFVCEDVAAKGQEALHGLERQAPGKVEAYFQMQLHQLDARAESDMAWDALGVLLEARGPMSPVEIAAVTGHPLRALRRAIEPILRFLLGTNRLQLMHAKLSELLEHEFTAQEHAHYRDLLFDWCRSFSARGWPDDTPEYVLEHWAAHLVDSGDHASLFALLNRRWVDVKLAKTGAPSGVADDVLLAVRVAESAEPPDLPNLLQFSLLLLSLGVRVPNATLGALVRMGRHRTALAYAALMPDPGVQASAYCHIADAIVGSEQLDKLDVALSRARRAAVHTPDAQNRGIALAEVATTLASAGRQGEATDLGYHAVATAREAGTDFAISPVARRLATGGLVDVALETIDELSSSQDPSFGDGPVVVQDTLPALVRADRLPEARQLIDRVGDPKDRLLLLVALAEALAAAGQAEPAHDIAEQVVRDAEAAGNVWFAASLLAAAAGALHLVGEELRAAKLAERAVRTADAVDDEHRRPWELAAVSRHLARHGLSSPALRAATAIGSPEHASARRALGLALEEIAIAAARNGAVSQASNYARESAAWSASMMPGGGHPIGYELPELDRHQMRSTPLIPVLRHLAAQGATFDPGDIDAMLNDAALRADAVLAYIEGLISVGRYADGELAAAGINDPHVRAEAQGLVAEAMACDGQQDGAERLVALAIDAARIATDRFGSSDAQRQLLIQLAKVGKVTEAADAATSITDPDTRAVACLAIVEIGVAEPTRGSLLSSALSAANAAGGTSRTRFLVKLARVVLAADASDVGGAFRAHREAVLDLAVTACLGETDPEARDQCASGLAATFAASDRPEVALRCASQVSNPWYGAGALANVAAALVRVGDPVGAAQVARDAVASAVSLGTSWAKGPTVATVVTLLADAGLTEIAASATSEVNNARDQIAALAAVAAALARAGDRNRARDFAQQAIDACEQQSPDMYAEGLASLYTTLAEYDLEGITDHIVARLRDLAGVATTLDKEPAIGAAAAATIAAALHRCDRRVDAEDARRHALDAAVKVQAGQRRDRAIAQVVSLSASVDPPSAVRILRNVSDSRFKAQALRTVLRQAELRRDPNLADVIQLAGSEAASIADAGWRARTLAAVARALVVIGRPREASAALLRSCAAARASSRQTLLEVVSETASVLAAVDRGNTLLRAYRAMHAVDSWYSSESSNSA